MAVVSIYVPEELKARMGAVGDKVNWSNLAQRVFKEAVEAEERRQYIGRGFTEHVVRDLRRPA